MNISNVRRDYTRTGLSERDVDADPIQQFALWLDDARQAGGADSTAMTLATANRKGRPSARIVLLKDFDHRGFVFFTNYLSRKGRDLAENPYASLVFFWSDLERQIRIDGSVEQISRTESDIYFQSRPLLSQLGAWASHQSQVIEGRDVIEQRFEQLASEYAEGPIPIPPFWGGYRLSPETIEFWQGRSGRLHDRLCYKRSGDNRWEIVRLSP